MYMKKKYKIDYKNELINIGGSSKSTENLNNNTEKKSGLTKDEIDEIKLSVKHYELREGSKLYRCQPDNCILNELPCEDTGKKGIYFSNKQFIPYGMIVEYEKPMNLCEYKTNKELLIPWGKYSFRCLEPDRFYNTYDDFNKDFFIPNINPQNNYYHIDDKMVPQIDLFQSDENYKLWYSVDPGDEIFIINKDDVVFVKDHGQKTVEEARNYLLNKLELIKELYKL